MAASLTVVIPLRRILANCDGKDDENRLALSFMSLLWNGSQVLPAPDQHSAVNHRQAVSFFYSLIGTVIEFKAIDCPGLVRCSMPKVVKSVGAFKRFFHSIDASIIVYESVLRWKQKESWTYSQPMLTQMDLLR
jgi:hypothetical protein